MDLLSLYHKIYTGTVLPSDFVEWACQSLHLDTPEIQKLASMSFQQNLNPFEVECMFAASMNSVHLSAPTKQECLKHHLKNQHLKLMISNVQAWDIVKEIYETTLKNDLFDLQMEWQEISDAMDDFCYGDNIHGYTRGKINLMIIEKATFLSRLT